MNGPVELVQRLADAPSDDRPASPRTGSSFAYGRTLGASEDDICTREAIQAAFKTSGYNVRELLLVAHADRRVPLPAAARRSDGHGEVPLESPSRASRGRAASPSRCRGSRSWGRAGARTRRRRRAAQRFLDRLHAGRHGARPSGGPRGTETAPVLLSPILAPLEPVKQQAPRRRRPRHEERASASSTRPASSRWLTGTPQVATGSATTRGGPSIDQVIATRISSARRPSRSLQIAVRWATGKSHGLLSPINAVNFEDNAAFEPHPAAARSGGDLQRPVRHARSERRRTTAAARLARKKSILDFVDRRYAALSARLGAADRPKLDQHLTKIREIEQGLIEHGRRAPARCVRARRGSTRPTTTRAPASTRPTTARSRTPRPTRRSPRSASS